jgi:dTDP-glucose 4,6-dehydratase
MHKRNLLVTGGAGFIGSGFVTEAVRRGDKVVVLDALTYAGNRKNLEHLHKDSYQLVIGNIIDKELVSNLLEEHKIDVIVNFAAESHVDNSIHAPAIFIETNIIGTFNLLQVALNYYRNLDSQRKENFRFIQISTDEVYGSLTFEDTPFTEESLVKPNSPYSASKASGDHLARAWFKTYGLPVIITNCTNNYGPRQHFEKLIPRMINCALAEESLPVYGDGMNIRDWIHVEDHVRGIYLAVEKGRIGEKYCFGGNAEKKNVELVKLICSYLDELRPRAKGKSYSELITFVKDRPGHDRRYAVNDSKAIKELGYKREYDFDNGLKHTIEWYLGKR